MSEKSEKSEKKEGLGEYVRQVRESTQRYARDLLSENEKLSSLAIALHAEKVRLDDEVAESRAMRRENEDLRAALERLTAERVRLSEQIGALREQLRRDNDAHTSLMTQLAEIERSNRIFTERYTDVEELNSNLANLYVASYRLHGSLSRAAVLSTIQEILINIVGSEEFGIYDFDRASGRLVLASSFGIDASEHAEIWIDGGPIATAMKSGAPWTVTPGERARLVACVPLKVEEKVTGAIVIFGLLAHKPALADLDHELFTLLATHAGMALYSCDLHAAAHGPGRAR